MQALLPAARLQLARGDIDLARAVVARGLRAVADDRPRAAELLAILVDVELAAGRTAAAEAAATELAARAAPLDLPTAPRPQRGGTGAGPGRRGRRGGRGRCARGGGRPLRPPAAPVATGPAAAGAGPAAGAGRRPGGRRAGRQGGRRHPGLARRRAVLRRCRAARAVGGRRATSRPARSSWPRCRRDGRWWVASCDGTTSRLADTKGLRYVAELVPTRGRSATSSTWSTGSRASRRLARSGGATSGMPARCSTAGRGPSTAAASSSCGPRSTTPSRPTSWSGRRPPRPSSTCWCASWPRPSASEGATAGRRRRPSGPASTSPARCERPPHDSRRPCRERARPRPAAAHRPVLRLRTRGR